MSDQNINSNPSDSNTQKVTDYAKAFDALRNSVNNISNPLTKLSNSVNTLDRDLSKFTDSISKLSNQNKDLADSGSKVQTEIASLSSSFSSWGGIINTVKTALTGMSAGLGGWGIAISAVLSVLSVHSDGIIKWVKNIMNGTTTLSALNKVIKDNNLVLNALNKSKTEGELNAQQELSHLKLLYTATQNHNLKLNERKKAISQIRDQYPGYFQNITDENILNGKAIAQYNDLTKAIIASSRAKAAEDIMTNNQKRKLGNDEKLSTLNKQLENYNKELKDATQSHKELEHLQVIGGSSYAMGTESKDTAGAAKVDRLSSNRDELKKTIADINTDSNILDRQNLALVKSVSDYTEKYGVKILSGLKTIENGRQHFEAATTKTDYFSEAEKLRKDSLARQLQTIYEGYGAEAQAENKRYEQELSGLKALLAKKKISQEEFNKVSQQLTGEHNGNLSKILEKYNREDAAKAQQAQNELIDLQNKGMQDGAEKQKKILTQQKEESLQQIKKSDDELIAQQQKIQAQLALAVATGSVSDAAELKKQLDAKELLLNINSNKRIAVEAQTQTEIDKLDKEAAQKEKLKKDQGTIDKDQSSLDSAKSPSAKLEAQKQLILDKAQFEIDTAEGNTVKITQIELKRNKDLADLDKQSQKQRAEQAIQIAQQIAGAAFSLISNSIKSSSDAKIKGMESDKAKELSNTNLTKSQKAAIEAKYKKKENDEKVKAFKANQKMQIAQAVINGAIGIQKTIAEWGMPLAIPFIIPTVATTAVQIATIASQKPPAFAKGGRFVSDGRGALLPGYSRNDNTNAYLRSGEAVVVSEAMRNPWARNLVSAINVAHGGRDFSATNPGKGYAIGGIFTDGGNANRYYNQPVNDIKEMANTVAYQMINNFPPIYVDVKDVNNQQNILAQTVDRVNL